MFAAESVSVRVSATPAYAVLLVAVHLAAAVAPGLAGLAWPFSAPVAGAILYQGFRCVRRDALRRGSTAVHRVEVRADGRVHLWTNGGREADATLGPDTWITPRFILLDLRSPVPDLPRGLLLTRRDAAGFRRLTVLLRWRVAGAETTPATASPHRGSP